MAMEKLLTGVQTTNLHNITHGPCGDIKTQWGGSGNADELKSCKMCGGWWQFINILSARRAKRVTLGNSKSFFFVCFFTFSPTSPRFLLKCSFVTSTQCS